MFQSHNNGVTLSPATASQAASRGFTAIPGATSLFRSTRYPGLLFKVVSSVPEALVAGGICVLGSAAGSTARFCYFGNSARAAAQSSQIGTYMVPTRTTTNAAAELVPYLRNQFIGRSAAESLITVHQEASTSTHFVGACLFLAIVTDATEGFILDVGTQTTATINTLPEASPISGAPPPGARTVSVKPFHDATNLRLTLRRASGYIAYRWPVNVRAFIASAKRGFLDAIENEDIRELYAGHYDSVVGEIPDTAESYGPRFIVSSMSTTAPVSIVAPTSYGHVGLASNLFFVESAYNITAENWFSNPRVGGCSFNAVPICDRGVYFEDGVSGLHPAWDVQPSGDTLTGNAAAQSLANSTMTNVYVGTTLDPLALAVSKFKLSESMLLPASNLFGRMFIAGAPAPNLSPDAVLDLTEIPLAPKTVPMSARPFSTSSTDPSVYVAETAAADSTAMIQRARLQFCEPYLPPFERQVTRFVRIIDARVQAEV